MFSIKQQVNDVISKQGIVITIGLGTTGKAVVDYFATKQVEVIAIEKQSYDKFIANSLNLKFLQSYDIKSSAVPAKTIFCFDDKVNDATLKKINSKIDQGLPVLSVISPGISRTSITATKIRSLNVPLVGELELALNLVDVPVIMVTGSNGKSTTVSIIDQILKNSNIDSYLCGNIGQPVLSVLKSDKLPEILVVEASSYQLESADSIRPKVAVYLNLSSNHLERHGTLENYHAAKLKIFANQTSEDLAILNCEDSIVYASKDSFLKNNITAKVGIFGSLNQQSLKEQNHSLIHFSPQENKDFIQVFFNGEVKKYDCSKSTLIGVHTRLNFAAAILATLAVGATDLGIQRTIENFHGLVHRLQKVPTKSGLFAINDSKSTTVASSVAAFDSIRKNFPSKPICLLIGGKMKIGSWQPLAQAILANQSQHMTRIICFGGDGAIILQELENYGIIASLGRNVSEAVSLACDWIRDNEVVLFSPGCASFDEFANFENRGDIFMRLIKER